MRFRPLSLRCGCGCVPSKLKSVGLTVGHELVVHWRCPACLKFIYSVKSLSDCWRECPQREGRPEETASSAEPNLRADDVRFLHSLGVTLPDDREL
jgi:hypothetical protein